MPGQHFTPMASISSLMQDMVITCNSPSKSFNIAGLQIANIVTSNAAWREQINRAININEICDVNPLGVEALMAAYTHQGAAWLDELNDYIWGNYCALKNLFATQLPHLPVTILEGTYLAWVNITSLHKSSDGVTQALLSQARVAVNSGTMYGEEYTLTGGFGESPVTLEFVNGDLRLGTERVEKLLCTRERIDGRNNLLDLLESQSVFFEDPYPPLHQFIVIGLIPCGTPEFRYP